MLFGLTFLTTTWAGALQQGVNLLAEPGKFAIGLPYSIGLMAILGFHELGHYFTARHYRMRVTPPYFIPVPFALGTFGAFIQMRSPAENRQSLFDVAVAGPWAGLLLAIPALILGLQSSTVLPTSSETDVFSGGAAVHSSILFALLAKAALGRALTRGYLLQLSPLAFAGWLGLLVTALNLLPIGQLDGGHMTRAMFGSRAGEAVSRAAMWGLLILALFVWPNLLFFAFIVFFIARRGTPPLNDLTPITAGRRWVGLFSYLVLLSIIVPMPRALWPVLSGIFGG
jgi:membrane-associated protease RseP (regulator of RpoE activity)